MKTNKGNQRYRHGIPALNWFNKIVAKLSTLLSIAGVALTKLLAQGKQVKLTSVATKKYLNPNAEHPSWFSSWGPVSNGLLAQTH